MNKAEYISRRINRMHRCYRNSVKAEIRIKNISAEQLPPDVEANVVGDLQRTALAMHKRYYEIARELNGKI